jgi:hypothetical protein
MHAHDARVFSSLSCHEIIRREMRAHCVHIITYSKLQRSRRCRFSSSGGQQAVQFLSPSR